MPLKIAVPTERLAGETRIAMTPEVAKKLKGLGAVVCLETDAGSNSHYPDISSAMQRLHRRRVKPAAMRRLCSRFSRRRQTK